MKMMWAGNRRKICILLVAVILGFSSCRSTREISERKIRPVSAEKLLKQMEQNVADFNHLTIRRLNCQFSNGESKTNFRVNLKAVKNEKILASISKLNIPVGRILLSPDSVKYVNYLERNFFVDDYSFLSRFLNFSLSFETIQSIIFNPANSGAFYGKNDTENYAQSFISYVEDGNYVLQSENQQNESKTGKSRKSIRKMNNQNSDDKNGIEQKMFINPRNFTLVKLILEDSNNARRLEVIYSDFVKVNKKDYPGSIEMKMISYDETIELNIKMNGFSTEKMESISLTVPESYEKIQVY